MRSLREAIVDGSVLLDLDARDVGAIFRHVLDFAVERGRVRAEDRAAVQEALQQREQEISTAIGHAVAVPHAYVDCLTEQTVVFVRLQHGLNLGAPDGIPTRFVFLLLGPADATAEHLDTLTEIARLMSDEQFRFHAAVAENVADLQASFDRYTDRTAKPIVEPPPAPVGLEYTGRFAGGLMDDLRRRLPLYASDIKDGLHTKSIASTLFLLFACLAPAVTFGGFMAQLTDNYIGPIEMLAGSAFCGIVYALFAGQPLIILGGTGPLLIFTYLLYDLTRSLEVSQHFLAVQVWVGLWTGLIMIVLAVTDASSLMRFFTRFTDEIFAALISLIFIYEALKALVEPFKNAAEPAQHAKGLLTVLLALGTLYLGSALSRIRRSRYLLPWMREFLADFGPAIALAAMTIVAILLHEVQLDHLPAPDEFRPTWENPETHEPRGWLVNPFDAPPWVWIASLGPAILLALLVYIDQNITARLVNNADNKLKKGPSYHFDLVIVGVLVAVCPFFGFPWLVAATVRSLNHVRSLATVEDVVTTYGEKRTRILHVRENRITGLSIHLLIGLSLFLLPYLQQVPMAVLYGLFLYMGIVSMAGNQFFERVSLWIMDSNLYPATHYTRRVPFWTIHKFTLIQLLGLAMLWLVKGSSLGIVFPLFILMLVPIRFLLNRLFINEHLAALDSEEEPDEEEWG